MFKETPAEDLSEAIGLFSENMDNSTASAFFLTHGVLWPYCDIYTNTLLLTLMYVTTEFCKEMNLLLTKMLSDLLAALNLIIAPLV